MSRALRIAALVLLACSRAAAAEENAVERGLDKAGRAIERGAKATGRAVERGGRAIQDTGAKVEKKVDKAVEPRNPERK